MCLRTCSKLCNCAVPPDHLRSEFLSRSLATFQNIGKKLKQGKTFELNVYFVRIFIKIYTVAIGKPERQVRKALHCDSKQQ